MISPTYFVSANHDHPTPGQTVTFYTGNSYGSTSYTYTVSNTYYRTQYDGQGSDLYLGELTTPVAASIATYPVLDLPSDSDYLGMTIWTYGYPNRVGLNNISSIEDLPLSGYQSRVMFYPYYANGGQQGANESYLEPGDSGGPSFAVVAVHWPCWARTSSTMEPCLTGPCPAIRSYPSISANSTPTWSASR